MITEPKNNCEHKRIVTPEGRYTYWRALGDITEDLICLVCGLSMDLNKVGRKIIFTKDEAVIRNLVWLTT